MKKSTISSLSVLLFLVFGMFLLNYSVTAQETSNVSPALPYNINKIITASCMPCHTSTGGLISRSKLNFTKWTEYSATKQKERAEKMYSELKKDAMPPKSARETRPEIIPTREQIDTIKKWADSLQTNSK
jgi:Haem-binding domain